MAVRGCAFHREVFLHCSSGWSVVVIVLFDGDFESDLLLSGHYFYNAILFLFT